MRALIWLLSLPPVAAASHALVAARFSDTINLGAILIGALVLIVAGLFTIRSNVAKVWRDNYQGEVEKVRHLEAQREEEREIRHALKTELASEKLKTDLTLVTARLDANEERATERHAALLAVSQQIAATLAAVASQIDTKGAS